MIENKKSEEDRILDKSSIAYYLATRTLLLKDKELRNHYKDNYSCYLFPIITCASLSCELMLKSLMNRDTGDYLRTHNLYKLFKNLKNETKNKIVENTMRLYYINNKKTHNIKDNEVFDILLNYIKLSFEDSRYIHEKKLKGDFDFLIALMFYLNSEEEYYKDFISSLQINNCKRQIEPTFATTTYYEIIPSI